MIRIEGFRRALKSAIDGPSTKDVRWTSNNHDFNVKKVKITKTQAGLEIDGTDGKHISHRKRFRPDDQVFYKCNVAKDGTVSDLEINITSTADILKEWFETAGKIAAVVSAILGGASQLKEDDASDPFDDAQPTPASLELLDGDWEGDVEMMIANIVSFAVAAEMPEVTRAAGVDVAVPPIVFTDLQRFQLFRQRLNDG